MILKQYKYVKEEISSKEWNPPTETCYFFQTGIRRSIRIEPRYTNWLKEECGEDEKLYGFNITLVYQCYETKIEKYSIDINLEEHYFSEGKSGIGRFVKDWVNGHFEKRTKESFETDLQTAIDKIQSTK